MKKTLILLCAAACLLTANAYLPPVAEHAGVRVEIGSFPQKIERPGANPYAWPLGVTEVAAGAPRAFTVTLANTTARDVAGILDVWMNDDWQVTGPQGTLTLTPQETRTLTFTGTAKPCALNALYPVHARFTPAGAQPVDAVHPIAVFMFKNPHAPRHVQKSERARTGSQPTAAEWSARAAQAVAAARRARTEGTDAAAGRWQLKAADGEVYGAGVAWGPQGLVDGVLAFTDGTRTLTYRGFMAEVAVRAGEKASTPQATITAEQGTLRIRWTLPGAPRAADGFPRIARLAVGPASEKLARVYYGFGNVYTNPKKFVSHAGGFGLSTRHVGADYANGLSVVQAVDVPPDSVECDGAARHFALVAHHDACYTFVPSTKGSFAAARRFRAVAGYRASAGHARLGARMCLDQWGGDYAQAAEDLARAAKYGLGDSIFVKHVWQCWGYDYRLPEIYPPQGDVQAFGKMRDACRRAGILFCPHDNYTDIYPDCDNYSYDLTVFNLDGTPQRAWFNPGRHALSYRWAPHAFHPWCLRNAKLLKAYDPEAIFIDVFTAHGPFDYLDRAGKFHSKVETSASWGKGFECYRQGFGRADTVCVSEAGQDHLIGIADAGESDHFGGAKLVGARNFDETERTPWHDIVSHGYYVLFAGGLGGRYQEQQWHKGGDAELHGYGSDDYLSNTIIGGRNPMCDGPFSRNAVKTFWLQHDACAELGAAELLDVQYDGGNVHRQHAFFSNGGEVWINRAENAAWQLPNGVVLPAYGYYAKTRTTMSGVVLKDGVRCAFARGPRVSFFDARKASGEDGACAAETRVQRAEPMGADGVRLFVQWKTTRATKGYHPFVHICDTNQVHEGIVFQSSMNLTPAMLAKPGTYETVIPVRVPAHIPAGRYFVRYGAWNPPGGGRLVLGGAPRELNRRVKGGTIIVQKDGDRIVRVTWEPEAPDLHRAARERLLGINRAGVRVDFGAVKTDGSFRLEKNEREWLITPLPYSAGFGARFKVPAGLRVSAVTAVEPEAEAQVPAWKQDAHGLNLTVDARAFAYRVSFKKVD